MQLTLDISTIATTCNENRLQMGLQKFLCLPDELDATLQSFSVIDINSVLIILEIRMLAQA